jgi:hypothetical protein
MQWPTKIASARTSCPAAAMRVSNELVCHVSGTVWPPFAIVNWDVGLRL